MKKLLKKLFWLIGLKITRTGTGLFSGGKKLIPSEADRFKWVQDMDIKTVIDIGGNIGQSALQFHKLFPDAELYSFEPLHDCYIQMNANLKNVPNFKCFNLALGDEKGEIEIHRSEFHQSSSLCKMAKLHKEAFPFSAGEKIEMVKLDTLDNIMGEFDLKDNILMKIDVQGFEDKVLKGSINVLQRVKVIIVETSFYELYEGQPMFTDIYNLLSEQGFIYSGSWDEVLNPIDGAHLQQDSIFIKR